jgi:hypothetical protein
MLDDDRIDLGIDLLGAGDGLGQQLAWADLFPANEVGKADPVIAAIFLEGHRLSR